MVHRRYRIESSIEVTLRLCTAIHERGPVTGDHFGAAAGNCAPPAAV